MSCGSISPPFTSQRESVQNKHSSKDSLKYTQAIGSPPFAELIEFQRIGSVRIAGKDQRIIEPAPPTSEALIYAKPTRAAVRSEQAAGSAKAISASYINTLVGDHAVYLIVGQTIKRIKNHRSTPSAARGSECPQKDLPDPRAAAFAPASESCP